MNYLYLILILFIILILLKAYIKIKYKFWAYQPVFHYYNLLYWIYPRGIINKELTEVNKFCNFLNITTTEFSERDEKTIKEIADFLGTHYYNTKDAKYIPTTEAITSYFIGNNDKTFISTYYLMTPIITNKEIQNIKSNVESKIVPKLLSIITTRPLNITLKNDKTFKIYYVDYLCVHTDHRKLGIAPEIIQTHEYIQCHKNKKYQIYLFKREGEITGIVPLTIYNTYQFDISKISKRPLLHASMKLIEINKLNIRLLTTFIHSQKEYFDCFVLPDLSNLINLINNETYKIYAIIQNDALITCYFFRDSHMYYNTLSDDTCSVKCIECFASISQYNQNEIFLTGFSMALYKYSKKLKAKLLNIEKISHNNIIINHLFLLNILPNFKNPTAYFLYNYAKRPCISEKVLLIC